MKQPILLLSVAFTCLLLASMGCNDDDSELPAPTQEGLNTFGCLVNGEVWRPQGNIGFPNLDISYDPGSRGGVMNLVAYKIADDQREDISIYSDSITSEGRYGLGTGNRSWRSAKYLGQSCWYDEDTDYIEGELNITRLDLSTEVISGIFEFTLAKPNCDTVRVTEGRFDMKI